MPIPSKVQLIKKVAKRTIVAKPTLLSRRDEALAQQQPALPPRTQLSLMDVYKMSNGRMSISELRDAESQGVSFWNNPQLPAMGYGGRYHYFNREVELEPGASPDILFHEIGAHAQMQINPLQSLLKMPFKTAIEQLPYAGIGSWATPMLRNALRPETRTAAWSAGRISGGTLSQQLSNAWSNFRNMSSDPREMLAYTAQGENPGYVNPTTFFGYNKNAFGNFARGDSETIGR